jgi:hypothetical protein
MRYPKIKLRSIIFLMVRQTNKIGLLTQIATLPGTAAIDKSSNFFGPMSRSLYGKPLPFSSLNYASLNETLLKISIDL